MNNDSIQAQIVVFTSELLVGLAVFIAAPKMSYASEGSACAAAYHDAIPSEEFEFFLARSKTVVGTVASVGVVAPVFATEFAVKAPIAIVRGLVPCSPFMAVDFALSGFSAGRAHSMSIASVCLQTAGFGTGSFAADWTDSAILATRHLRRIDIGAMVEAKVDQATCLEREQADLKAAYEALESLILNDRYYKKLTPVQLDEVDQKLRNLKKRMTQVKWQQLPAKNNIDS